MSKKNGKQRPVHTNVLVKSDEDAVGLGQAVEDRFVQVLNDYMRMKNETVTPPKELDRDVLLWRYMRLRHSKGDFRHTRDELKSTRRVADWTLRMNCALKGQDYKPIEWKD